MAVPMGSEPDDKFLNWARDNGGEIAARITMPDKAVVDGVGSASSPTAWVSMNQEHRARGHNIFQPYQVNEAADGAGERRRAIHALPAGASRRGGDG
jgi:ornithine carbamoyltransferase